MPPVVVVVMLPLFPPKQLTSTYEPVIANAATGSVMVFGVMVVQPLASVTVNV